MKNSTSVISEVLLKLAKIFHVSTDFLPGNEDKKQTLDVTGLNEEDIQLLEHTIELLRKKNLECK